MWRFVKDFLIYGIAPILGKIAGIFLIPIYTSILTTEEYGAMALITSCKGVLDLISNLNIHSGIARDYYDVSNGNRKTLVSTGLFSIIGISVFVCLAAVSSRTFWCETVLGMESDYLLAFTLMLFSVPTGSLSSYLSIMTRYQKKPVLYTIASFIQLVTQISLSIYLVVFARVGVVGVFVGVLVGEVVTISYLLYINRGLIGLKFDIKYLKRALTFALPTLPAILAGWMDSSLGQIIVGRTISKADLGVYSIALSLTSVFVLVSTTFQNVWGPYLYENYKNESFNRDLKRLFSVFVTVLLFISVSLSLFSKEIILLLTNPDYLKATKYTTLLCVPLSIYLLFPIATSGISISRDTKYIGISYIMGSVLNVFVLFCTIGHLGVVAVPLCLGLSRIVTYSTLYKISVKKINYRVPNWLLVVFVLIIGLCYLIQICDLKVYYRIAIAIVAYGLMFLYLNTVVNFRQLAAKMKVKFNKN
jgi:O-antigen/teichoic acid export membrane protein